MCTLFSFEMFVVGVWIFTALRLTAMALIKMLQRNFSISGLNRNMILGKQFKAKDAHRIKKNHQAVETQRFFVLSFFSRDQSFSSKDSFFFMNPKNIFFNCNFKLELKFVNINIKPLDKIKHSNIAVPLSSYLN